MATQKYSTMTEEQRVKYEKAVGIAFREEQGITEFVDMPLSLPKHMGDTVNYRIFNLGVDKSVIPEDTELPELDITVTKETITPKKYGGKVKLTEELMFYSIDDLMKLTTPEIGKNYREVSEELAFTEAITSTNIFFTTGSDATRPTATNQIDNTNYFTFDDALKIGETMRIRKVPKIKLSNGYRGYVCLITPQVATRLMSDDKWIKFNQFKGSEKVEKGSIGIINNVEFIQSTFVPTTTSGAASAPTAKCVCLGGKSFGGIKIDGKGKDGLEVWYTSPDKADPGNENFAYISAKMFDAYKLLRSEGVLVVETYNG